MIRGRDAPSQRDGLLFLWPCPEGIRWRGALACVDGAVVMIVPLYSGRRAGSGAVAKGFGRDVRLFQLRYGGSCCVSGRMLEQVLRSALPYGARWHGALLGAGRIDVDVKCERCVVRGCDAAVEARHRIGCEAEVLWTDVMVDLGYADAGREIDFGGRAFALGGRLPRVRRCSGVHGEWMSEDWQTPWGGPFGRAYDRELSMLEAPHVFWRIGRRLLVDIGDDEQWEVSDGVLRVARDESKELRGRGGGRLSGAQWTRGSTSPRVGVQRLAVRRAQGKSLRPLRVCGVASVKE